MQTSFAQLNWFFTERTNRGFWDDERSDRGRERAARPRAAPVPHRHGARSVPAPVKTQLGLLGTDIPQGLLRVLFRQCARRLYLTRSVSSCPRCLYQWLSDSAGFERSAFEMRPSAWALRDVPMGLGAPLWAVQSSLWLRRDSRLDSFEVIKISHSLPTLLVAAGSSALLLHPSVMLSLGFP